MWFGEDWGAPLNEDGIRMPVPLGQPCLWCDELIAEGDRGVIIPCLRDVSSPPTLEPTHFECHMRSTIGSVGHLSKKCHCYGGNEDDPPGLTKRQAAIAAWALLCKMTGMGEA